MDKLGQSLLLIGVGAAITLVTTLLVEWVRGRSATKLEAQRLSAKADFRLQDALRDDERELYVALRNLTEMGTHALRSGAALPIESDQLVAVCRHNYLLIPQVAIRQCMADANVLIANRNAGNVSLEDWTQAVATASFVVAAHMRGEDPAQHHAQQLHDLRAKYPKP